MTNKPVGGRGKKAPYNTVVIRVPEPLADQVNLLIDDFRQGNLATFNQKLINREVIIEESRKILRAKKSAKQSILKLLQVFYSNTITEKDLDNL